jgi:hypothetical protein
LSLLFFLQTVRLPISQAINLGRRSSFSSSLAPTGCYFSRESAILFPFNKLRSFCVVLIILIPVWIEDFQVNVLLKSGVGLICATQARSFFFSPSTQPPPAVQVCMSPFIFFVLLQLQFLFFFKILNEKESAHPILAISVSPIIRVAVHC